jgi:hypothetical protein
MSIGMLTDGWICNGGGGNAGPVIITELVPSLTAAALEPTINTEGQKPPEFEMLAVEDQVPEVSAKGDTPPLFEISPVIDPIPSADTKKVSDTPEVLIKPVVDLRPTITNKDDD